MTLWNDSFSLLWPAELPAQRPTELNLQSSECEEKPVKVRAAQGAEAILQLFPIITEDSPI